MARLSVKKLWVYCFCFSAVLFFLIVTLQRAYRGKKPVHLQIPGYWETSILQLLLLLLSFPDEKLTPSALPFLLVLVELGQFEKKKPHHSDLRGNKQEVDQLNLFKNLLNGIERLSDPGHQYPILVWWSPLTGEGSRLGGCGKNTCFFTIDKTYYDHTMTEGFLFYGTDFNIESLPFPRKPSHHWALFHEESPKNNYKLFHEPSITLFNHTATFSSHSHMPLTTQYLESVEVLKSHTYLVPLSKKNSQRQNLAPLVYVQSDCDPPSDRDSYVRELMKYIEVDSYGECLHNRDLPPPLKYPSAMDDRHFYGILAQYKFILSFENAVCDDYITEKFWRPLKLGVVPVYYGSPSIAKWLPSNKSAVLVNTFASPQDLAEYIKDLDQNDKKYEAYLEWKWTGEISNQMLLTTMKERNWGVQDISQDNYIDAFECMVCNRVWENLNRKKQGLVPRLWKAQANHLSCPAPKAFSLSHGPTRWSSVREVWKPSFEQSKKEARALRQLAERNANFTVEEFWKLVFKDQK
ncbi:alpha-(1,3)-fucosyltransferase 10-like isoform X2 [Acipenser ruthenus]|uniref:alpha-(1,3)-fucosyltransferase 10-like isoform X2 n=1 Tax=Acipenser ruthenus TaxID=7906 RepID=UPI00145A6E55|nr:alpha-(1,3)-fucosyltransferase 10-like isoform X2 [Acipenser ruthenus]